MKDLFLVDINLVLYVPDVKFQFIHGSDEESHDLCYQLAGVALVVLDGDGSVLLDSLQGCGSIQSVLCHERLHCWELISLNLTIIN